jgi:hypothetical protein
MLVASRKSLGKKFPVQFGRLKSARLRRRLSTLRKTAKYQKEKKREA